MERDDLKAVEWGEYDPKTNQVERIERVATDADLASLGYVRLDGIDMDGLQQALAALQGDGLRRARSALADVFFAIDGEGA